MSVGFYDDVLEDNDKAFVIECRSLPLPKQLTLENELAVLRLFARRSIEQAVKDDKQLDTTLRIIESIRRVVDSMSKSSYSVDVSVIVNQCLNVLDDISTLDDNTESNLTIEGISQVKEIVREQFLLNEDKGQTESEDELVARMIDEMDASVPEFPSKEEQMKQEIDSVLEGI